MALINLIKYDGGPHAFAWKHPNSKLGTWTQLIVNETQEAVLYKGGQALDWFGPGRHTLETANIPILSKLVNIPFGGKSPFSAEVWYVNKANTLDIKWGTPTPIQLQDPKYSVFVPLRAFGQFGIKIGDAKTFLTKLVGTLPSFNSADIIKYFRGVYLTMVKDAIAEYLVIKKVPILEINAYILDLSESLQTAVAPKLQEYGIELVNFYVNDISVPDDDPSVINLKAALAKKAEMDIIGYSYTQERSFDTLGAAAANTSGGSAPLMGAGMGMAMGVGIGGAMGGAMGNMAAAIDTTPKTKCPHCHSEITPGARFCPNCGKPPVTEAEVVACPKCGASNKTGTKFCGECGATLVKVCAKCGAELPPGMKFCPECGKKVEG
jgi:membrane protease subunit (stomatin/prohibitin family)